MNNILLGAAAITLTVCCFIAPIQALRYYLKNKRYEAALRLHSIVLCSKCNTYAVGKHTLCNVCIKELATDLPTQILLDKTGRAL